VENADVGRMVQNEVELIEAVRSWLRDEKSRAAIGHRVEVAFAAHRGASQRVASLVGQALSEAGRWEQSTSHVPTP